MHLRREVAVVETYERYRRQERDHANRKLVEHQRLTQRIQKKFILTVAEKLKEKYRLPENRQPLSIFYQEHKDHNLFIN